MQNRAIWALILTVLVVITISMKSSNPVYSKGIDIVVYGGGPQAVAAALKASDATNGQKNILLVVPESKLGSVWTAGAQNLFDWNRYKSSELPVGLPNNYSGAQAGSAYLFMQEMSAVFPPEKMAAYLSKLIAAHSNIRVLYETDIRLVESALAAGDSSHNKYEITAVTLEKLKRDQQNRYVFDETKSTRLQAPIFIDASETGRLVRLSGHFLGSVGREDRHPDQAQMAATLMFKMKSIQVKGLGPVEGVPFYFQRTEKGSLQIWGGYEIKHSALFSDYTKHSEHFRLKPYNAGEDGYTKEGSQNDKTEFWMNTLLIYDVDARKAWRDKVANDGLYPEDGGLDPEIAREMAIKEISKPEFLQMIQTLPGFTHAQIVMKNGQPVVGDILYLRESVHSSLGNHQYALDEKGVKGSDASYYTHRIGLGYYLFDSNTYKKNEPLTAPWPEEPWYVPYETLLSPALSNVVIPGYAANISSFAWTAMRVYPNLTVLGDAAGIAAGLTADGKFTFHHPTDAQILLLQKKLREAKAILDK